MAYVPVPKDLSKIKSKVLFNLTKRQLLCFGGGGLIGLPLYFMLRKPLGSSAATMCMMLVLVPAMMFGLFEKNGQPLEKVLAQMFRVSFLRPKVRPYRTRNFYDTLRRQEQLNEEVKRIVRKKDAEGSASRKKAQKKTHTG
jgi:hypothetical protein